MITLWIQQYLREKLNYLLSWWKHWKNWNDQLKKQKKNATCSRCHVYSIWNEGKCGVILILKISKNWEISLLNRDISHCSLWSIKKYQLYISLPFPSIKNDVDDKAFNQLKLSPIREKNNIFSFMWQSFPLKLVFLLSDIRKTVFTTSNQVI